MFGRKSRLFAKFMSITLIMALMLLSACAGNNNRQIGEYAADKNPNETVANSGNDQAHQAANKAYSDEELVKELPGFQNGYKKVNGITIHYVEGGKGEPLFLLPGWPETWYAFHKIMPALAEKYHVYSIDYRGMGSSDKPESGYDKKTMASDIYALVKELGYEKINIAGHDIGATISYSFAANYPQATKKLALLDASHPNENFLKIPILPPPGVYDVSNPDRAKFYWWFAFNTIPELPEQLLQGKQLDIAFNWLFDYLAYDKAASITKEERAIYIAAYAKPEALRAGNDWYRAFRQDIEDLKTYKKLSVPVLGIGGVSGYQMLDAFLREYATDPKLVKLDKTGHWISEENPQETINLFNEFFR
ncbi:pimeloyl-ACP methyl ester carboxylesterase [Paenibacillus sp. V4I3]|uniref:alpha/beta fold hydrolase n=1 Tax=unclassified Paenibacillus TaxID=185978 RepID=UPI0027845D71|nr:MULTISPECIES: alpha/beta hydrolase [unclassified Paenibacillus]MDQ0875897.1 pimeloyl-ACP methyl ester carboxylesterase [Paenibacillus sp. V4I3]MDQ0888040.1 pimeloyl-ACP methyl ester carboxylesterase [Paenibacillus sp. V4I9]